MNTVQMARSRKKTRMLRFNQNISSATQLYSWLGSCQPNSNDSNSLPSITMDLSKTTHFSQTRPIKIYNQNDHNREREQMEQSSTDYQISIWKHKYQVQWTTESAERARREQCPDDGEAAAQQGGAAQAHETLRTAQREEALLLGRDAHCHTLLKPHRPSLHCCHSPFSKLFFNDCSVCCWCSLLMCVTQWCCC